MKVCEEDHGEGKRANIHFLYRGNLSVKRFRSQLTVPLNNETLT